MGLLMSFIDTKTGRSINVNCKAHKETHSAFKRNMIPPIRLGAFVIILLGTSSICFTSSGGGNEFCHALKELLLLLMCSYLRKQSSTSSHLNFKFRAERSTKKLSWVHTYQDGIIIMFSFISHTVQRILQDEDLQQAWPHGTHDGVHGWLPQRAWTLPLQ